MTGATGLLGTEVVARLLATTQCTIYALVRADSDAEAAHRLQALWWEDKGLAEAIGQRVVAIAGDMTDDPSRLAARTGHLAQHITHVIHCAAETGLQKSKEQLWRINVEGTRHMVQLAKGFTQLQRFTYISTAYVAGTQSGRIVEDGPLATCDSAFYSLYEQSKAEAERVVGASGLPLTICRPGMIVGNSQTGRTRNFNTVYYVLKLLLQGRLPVLPVSRQQTVNVVPVDDVARRVVALTFHPDAEGKTFHLTLPHDRLPRVGELVTAVRTWASDNLQLRVPQPVCLPMPFMRGIAKRYNIRQQAKSRSLLSNMTALMPYFYDDHDFDRTNTSRLTGDEQPDWQVFLPQLLSFACRHNFMRISDGSIFQQACIRRESSHYAITYHDITADGIKTISGHEMNGLVGHFVGCLQQHGVKAGDTVALSGINCAEHAAIDQAIGLVGATSVPIYYTTPADEISLLLRKSHARWFFVGDQRLKQHLGQLPAEVTTIPFGPLATPVAPVPSKPASTPIDPSKPATIRYTSGTTGEPKGVVFNFSQLKWMGEVLTNLLPWKDRNSEMRYLSFLPMSHVVEGILAAYAPYCMLCRAKIYYLNDFQMLTRALPMVRPTVFFSVPRFYEKLWEQIEQHPLGKKYLTMSDGLLRRLTASGLRRAVLRKAGLDRCSQLLVGSAPISEELLLHFRALGIEIYNAYGQTEAPLITLNRLGKNVIPSIGTPLPDTTVSQAPDGELVVAGPQVALGYYELPSEAFRDGWLHTGDLGHVDAQGNVFISGRKKDMLITSYGKNINCTKIEQRLADIACVEQAVLVGEQRPYCTALLWTNGPTDTLQDDIDRMNASLSHPEQVKRWCIIGQPLSIERGELTPNLKVKRSVVVEHYEQEIKALYNDGTAVDGC